MAGATIASIALVAAWGVAVWTLAYCAIKLGQVEQELLKCSNDLRKAMKKETQ